MIFIVMPKTPEKKLSVTGPAIVPTHAQDLDRELHEMYDGQEGPTKRDMSRLEQADHSSAKRVMVGLMAFFAMLAAVSWAGFFFFSPGQERFKGEAVSVIVDGPGEIKSGELVTFVVRYKNDERVPLGTATLEIRLPKSLHVVKTDPATDGSTWQIGSIAPGKDGIVTIQGVSFAPLNKELDIQAILTYRPADFNSEFQKVSTRTIVVKDSVLELAATGATKVLPGDKVVIALEYHNVSADTISGIRLRGVWPDSFIPESSSHSSIDNALREWKLEPIAADGKGTITVTGSFASSAEGPQELGAQLGLTGENDAFELQRQTLFSTTVLKGDLITALILNGKAEDQPIRFGDKLRYAVTYRNTGNAILEDVTLSVLIESTKQGKLLKWNELADRAKGVRDGDHIIWTKKQVPSLSRIGAGEEGTLDFEIPVLDAPVAGAKDTDYRIVSTLEASVAKIDGDTVKRSAKTQPISAKILSDAKLSGGARYFNDDGVPVGSGPIPPEVGKETTYRATWKIENSLHELADLKLSAKLPPNVVWTGISNVDAGELKFDAAGEKMTWTLNWMPVTIKSLTVSFDVKIVPGENDKGRIPTIVDAAIFEGIDKVTGDSLLLSTSPLSTALDGDDLASGKGRVQ